MRGGVDRHPPPGVSVYYQRISVGVRLLLTISRVTARKKKNGSVVYHLFRSLRSPLAVRAAGGSNPSAWALEKQSGKVAQRVAFRVRFVAQ